MSNPNPSNTDQQWRWAIGGTVVLLLGLFVCIAVVVAKAEPDTDPMPLVTLLVGLVSTTVLAMLALLKATGNARNIADNHETAKQTAQTVSELANGSMDAKIRLAVAEVVTPEMIDKGYHPQLALDRKRLDDLDRLAAELRKRVADE